MEDPVLFSGANHGIVGLQLKPNCEGDHFNDFAQHRPSAGIAK
jgi:hypothetical protein